MSDNYKHISVLLDEAVNALNIHKDGIYLDGTFGYGGHSRLILSKLGQKGRLLAIDRDPAAIERARAIDDPRFTIIHGRFSLISMYTAKLDLLGKVNGILLDLGISSPQLDNPKRGFSFMRDGPLDMRMDNSSGQSAADWLAKASVREISWVLKTFGEERYAKRIAEAIVKYNRHKTMNSTRELAILIANHMPWRGRDKRKHPVTRSFQAIRMYINSELEEIQQVLNSTPSVLSPSGRLSVISFHSLEDRIVKRFICQQSSNRIEQLRGLPLTEAQIAEQYHAPCRQQFMAIGKVRPSKKEIIENPRARSAILRFAEKLSM